MDEDCFGYSTWKDELDKDELGLLSQYPNLDPVKLWKVFGFEAWVKDCIRSLAFTHELIPFHAWSAGMWLEQPDDDPPLLIAIITPLSDPQLDPQLAARQLIEKHRKLFGDKATRSTRKDEVANARMLHRKRDGMSYTDIAIQSLRQQHPDIVSHAHRYRAEILPPFHAPINAPMGVSCTASDRVGLSWPVSGLCLNEPQTPLLACGTTLSQGGDHGFESRTGYQRTRGTPCGSLFVSGAGAGLSRSVSASSLLEWRVGAGRTAARTCTCART
jgi:hypothetical protein